MHKSLDEFEFRHDPTTDYGVSCPRASEKSMYNVVNTLAPSFLIKPSSFLQVTKDSHKVWTEFEIQLDRMVHFGVSCHLVSRKIPIDL